MLIASEGRKPFQKPQRLSRALRLPAAAAIPAIAVAICERLPHVNVTTVSLLMVPLVVGIAIQWGMAAGVVSAFVAALGLDYYFLPPRGLEIYAPEHLVALIVFLLTAYAIGHLSVRANRQRDEAVRRRDEIEKLHHLVEALSECHGAEAVAGRLSGLLLGFAGVDGAAVYDRASGRVVRGGARGPLITDERLREVSASPQGRVYPEWAMAFEPVHDGAEPAGAIGIAGDGISPLLLRAIAESAGTVIARATARSKAMEIELGRRADELRAAVLDSLAHEARGRLGSIRLAATTLQSQPDEGAVLRQELLRLIVEESGRMNRWIEEAVRINRAKAEQMAVNLVPHDVKHLVTETVSALAVRLAGREVTVSIPDALPHGHCDGELTRRVLHLLLDNAVNYSPAGSPIAIAALLEEDSILVSVRDAGPGIPEHEKERIFERHYRGLASAGTEGTGLGLASAKAMVECQGGEIWVTDRPGGGAVFHFTLRAPVGVASDE